MVSKLEHLVAAIGWHNGLHDPESEAYKLRNPLLVRSFGRPGKHDIDNEGRRIFESLISGYRACLFDIELKASGESRAGLKETDALENLLGVYGIKGPAAVERVVKFLKKALADQDLSGRTPMTYFLENGETKCQN